jgi:uncharacterized repeat protein (TIGR03803 family)
MRPIKRAARTVIPSWWKTASALCVLGSVAAIAAPAQNFKTLVTFYGPNGDGPGYGSLVQGTDGDLYGTTNSGGPNGYGSIFRMTLSGKLTTLYSFSCSFSPQEYCAYGSYPEAGLVLGTDEKFYGTTGGGGTSTACAGGCGTVFSVSRDGVLTTLHSFDSADGSLPFGALVEGVDGNFYGTTFAGGASGTCVYGDLVGCGTVFKITSKGVLTTLHSFDGSDGANPYAALVQGSDGKLYGTTYLCGGGSSCSSGSGTVFRITPAGILTTLHTFTGSTTDGANPYAPVVEGGDGNFYGTTSDGGLYEGGTVFKITPKGTTTVLVSFGGTTSWNPTAGLIQATDGDFYGMTSWGGENCLDGFGSGCGSIFKITADGTWTLLYSFCSQFECADGWRPDGGLVQATDGNFYGATSLGGAGNGDGTIFGLSVGLDPFVVTLPTARRVGQGVIILGNSLKGSTAVTFNGTPSVFTIVSSTEIATAVPYGATTGTVQVVMPGGSLSSNVPFRVLP